MARLPFVKMHGIGNDYVYVDCFAQRVEDPIALARRVSPRRTGIGSDGLILICPSDSADCRMEMYNADGSRMTDLGAFRIERSTADSPFTPIATLAVSDRDRFQQERRFRWVDTDTTVGGIYQYRVVSFTTDGYGSEPSNIVTIERAIPTPAPTVAPTPPPTPPRL